MKKAIIIGIIISAVICVFSIHSDNSAPTKSECVGYWTNRVSTWNNPPTQIQIEEDNNYCGGIHE